MGQETSKPNTELNIEKPSYKIYVKQNCYYSLSALKLLQDKDHIVITFNPNSETNYETQKESFRLANHDLETHVAKDYTFPCVFKINQDKLTFIGGYTELKTHLSNSSSS